MTDTPFDWEQHAINLEARVAELERERDEYKQNVQFFSTIKDRIKEQEDLSSELARQRESNQVLLNSQKQFIYALRDTLKLKEGQSLQHAVEDLVSDRNQLERERDEARAEAQRAWGCDQSHVATIAFMQGNYETLKAERDTIAAQLKESRERQKCYQFPE
jgi:chromosome segregation ATPase